MNNILEIFPSLINIISEDITEIFDVLADEYFNLLYFGSDIESLSSVYIQIENTISTDYLITTTSPSQIIINPKDILTQNKIYKIIYTCTTGESYTQTYFYKNSSQYDLTLPISYDVGDPRNYPKIFNFSLSDEFYKQHIIKIEIYEFLNVDPTIIYYFIDLNSSDLNDNIYFDNLHLVYNKIFNKDNKLLYIFESEGNKYILPAIVKWENKDKTDKKLNITNINLKPYRINQPFELGDNNNLINSYEYLIDTGYAYKNNIQVINDKYYLLDFKNNLIELGKFKPLQLSFLSNATYQLQTNSSNINEGSSVTFTLNTTNISNGELIPYTIYGINQSDLSSGSITGNFTINNNTATSTITLANDNLTEGIENVTLFLDNGKAYISVTVNDTSLSPIYQLQTNSLNINEGSSVTFTLNTTGISNGTSVPYTITGITLNDLSAGSLTGNFTLSNRSIVNTCSAIVSITLANDNLTEGIETATLSLNNGQASTSVTVNDTSLNPASYTLRTDNSSNYGPNNSIAYEGSTVTFILNTTGLFSGSLVPYTIFGLTSSDLSIGSSLTGNFTLSNRSIINTCSSSMFITLTGDQLTDGTETLTMTVNNQQVSASLNIIDTSKNGPIKILYTAWN